MTPISERILRTPTAWRPKIGEAALASQASEDWDVKAGPQRLRRLGCVGIALVVITVVMMVL